MKARVIKIEGDSIVFDNAVVLTSEHDQKCCEHHYLSMADLTMADFEGLEFDLSNDNFFRRIQDYGIELIPTQGHSVKIPGYGYNNGYYSADLTLVLSDGAGLHKTYNITECQEHLGEQP